MDNKNSSNNRPWPAAPTVAAALTTSTATAVVGAWLYRVANAGEYSAALLTSVGSGVVRIAGDPVPYAFGDTHTELAPIAAHIAAASSTMTVTTTTTPTNHDRIPSPSPSMQKEPFVVVNEDTPSPASAGPPPPSRQPAISWTHLSMPSSPPHHTSSVVPPPQPDQQQQQLSASLCADVDMVHLTESVVRSDLSNGVPATRAVPRHPGGGGPVLPPPRQSSGEFDNASSSSARHIRHQKTPSQHGKATDTAMDFEVLSPPRSSNMPIAAQRSTGMPAPSSRGSRSPSISSFSSSGSSPFFASSHPPGRSAHNGGGMMLLGTSDTEEDDDFDHHHHDHHDDEDDDRQRRRRLSHQKHEDMDDSTTLSDSHVIVECGGPGTDEVFQLETEGEFRFIESVPMPPRPAPLLAHSPSSAPLPPPPSSASESGRAVTSTSTVRRKSLLLSAAASRHQSEKTALALLTRWSTFPWFTYRTSIAHWLVRADTGWGCMHRTGQMLLARALLVARFGHVLSPALYKKDEPAYTRILGLFADPQSPKHQGGPWSLPRICEAGAVEGAPIGAWYSPTTVARALARIGNVPEVKARSNAVLHVAGDATVVQDAVALSARDPTSSVSWTPVVLLIPVRLGLDRIGAGHVKRLLQVFQWPQFIGCAGGKKDASLFFCGTWSRQSSSLASASSDIDLSSSLFASSVVVNHPSTSDGSPFTTPTTPTAPPPMAAAAAGSPPPPTDPSDEPHLLYLDPHLPQRIPPFTAQVPNPHFHTTEIRALPVSKVDPCMLLGFLLQDASELDDFVVRAATWDDIDPLFSVVETCAWPVSSTDGSSRDGSEKGTARAVGSATVPPRRRTGGYGEMSVVSMDEDDDGGEDEGDDESDGDACDARIQGRPPPPRPPPPPQRQRATSSSSPSPSPKTLLGSTFLVVGESTPLQPLPPPPPSLLPLPTTTAAAPAIPPRPPSTTRIPICGIGGGGDAPHLVPPAPRRAPPVPPPPQNPNSASRHPYAMLESRPNPRQQPLHSPAAGTSSNGTAPPLPVRSSGLPAPGFARPHQPPVSRFPSTAASVAAARASYEGGNGNPRSTSSQATAAAAVGRAVRYGMQD